jgi:hypothetical protein
MKSALDRVALTRGQKLPLRDALQLELEKDRLGAFVKRLDLPILERLEIFAQLQVDALVDGSLAVSFPWGKLGELRKPAIAKWATAWMKRVVKMKRPPRKGMHALLFAALVANDVPIARAWESHVPIPFVDEFLPSYIQTLERIPEERRGAVAAKSLAWHMSSGKVVTGLHILKRLPLREVAEIVLENADKVDFIPKRDTMAKLAALAKKHPAIRDVVAPHLGPPKLELAIAGSRKTMAGLSPFEKKQVVVCGEHYDGKKRPYAARTRTFGEHFQVRDIVVAKTKKPAFTAFLYLVESGTIFVANTTKVAAVIIQGSLLGPDGAKMKDRDLHEALQPVVQF